MKQTNYAVPDVVRGHEIWLEHSNHPMIMGDEFECNIAFGHNMNRDGEAQIDKIKAAVYTPQSKKVDLQVFNKNDDLIINFKPVLKGNYTVTAEYDAGIYTVTEDGWQRGPKKNYVNVKRSGYYYQYAKAVISGYEVEKASPVIGQELEIIPLNVGHYHVEDVIKLKVFYEGTPLADGILTAAVGGKHGKAVELPIDKDGMISVSLDIPGNWMFKVRHSDKSKSAEDEYDEKVITTVFTLMGVH
ncbi:MAG: DUF4198 domain-containing protein [Desulfamplus sp.]|nr:DUF4198 domain-containing protein [Desulfamplus sp.]